MSKMKLKVMLVIVAASLVSIGCNASATIVTNAPPTGPNAYVPAIGTWITNSALMKDMEITATFADTSTSGILKWGTGYNGGVSTGDVGIGNGWRLYMANPSGSTFTNSFTLEAWGNTDIKNLFINAYAGNTVFDIDPRFDDTVYSTINSKDGNPFADSYVNGYGVTKYPVTYSGINIEATYSTPVAINGFNPVYDIYGSLSLSFTNTTNNDDFIGFFSDSRLTFITDTDNVDYNPVPEPATLLLFGIGITALVGRRLKR
jgi:hypothetical protein